MAITRNGPHAVDYGAYVTVWLALMILLALTVTAAGLGLGALSVLAVLAIAGVKSALVLNYFMHLKYEGFLIRLVLFVGLAVLVIIIALTYLEVITR
jgi:cytochrome c oxidase subunit 4